MFDRLVAKKRQEEGFTLIELLIVIIILGILAAVVVFGVTAFRDDSVSKACKTDMKSVETAAQAFVAKTGAAPANIAAMVPDYLRTSPNTSSATGDYYITYTQGTGTAFTVAGNKTTSGNPAC